MSYSKVIYNNGMQQNIVLSATVKQFVPNNSGRRESACP